MIDTESEMLGSVKPYRRQVLSDNLVAHIASRAHPRLSSFRSSSRPASPTGLTVYRTSRTLLRITSLRLRPPPDLACQRLTRRHPGPRKAQYLNFATSTRLGQDLLLYDGQRRTSLALSHPDYLRPSSVSSVTTRLTRSPFSTAVIARSVIEMNAILCSSSPTTK